MKRWKKPAGRVGFFLKLISTSLAGIFFLLFVPFGFIQLIFKSIQRYIFFLLITANLYLVCVGHRASSF